jgi:hypothetical protein
VLRVALVRAADQHKIVLIKYASAMLCELAVRAALCLCS